MSNWDEKQDEVDIQYANVKNKKNSANASEEQPQNSSEASKTLDQMQPKEVKQISGVLSLFKSMSELNNVFKQQWETTPEAQLGKELSKGFYETMTQRFLNPPQAPPRPLIDKESIQMIL